jgi:hypothetical protein
MSKLLFLALILSFQVLSAEQCTELGGNCYSPYFSSAQCCKGLSCKSFRKGYRCYPENCVGGLEPCTEKSKCCVGTCKPKAYGGRSCQ